MTVLQRFARTDRAGKAVLPFERPSKSSGTLGSAELRRTRVATTDPELTDKTGFI